MVYVLTYWYFKGEVDWLSLFFNCSKNMHMQHFQFLEQSFKHMLPLRGSEADVQHPNMGISDILWCMPHPCWVGRYATSPERLLHFEMPAGRQLGCMLSFLYFKKWSPTMITDFLIWEQNKHHWKWSFVLWPKGHQTWLRGQLLDRDS